MALLKPSILQFKFNDFSSLTTQRGKPVPSNSGKMTDIHGEAWRAAIRPGGAWDSDYDGDDPFVEVGMQNAGKKSVFASCTFVLRDSRGNVHSKCFLSGDIYEPGQGWGVNLVKRSEILDAKNDVLVNDTLIIDSIIQIKPTTVHVSSNPFGANMLRLLENNENADVTFEVDGELITAHKLILEANSPTLFDFCEGNDAGSTIPIKDMKADHFRTSLRYIYGADVSDTLVLDESKDLIICADKLGVSGLKMVVEANLVQSLVLEDENVTEWLLFSHEKTCPLLKEHAVAYFVARAADLAVSKQSEKLNQSPELMRELLKELAISSMDDPRFQTMSVNELRKNLDEKGLDAEGSKEALISQLQASKKRKLVELSTTVRA